MRDKNLNLYWVRRGRMIVGFITTCASAPITTIVVSSNRAQARCARYNIM